MTTLTTILLLLTSPVHAKSTFSLSKVKGPLKMIAENDEIRNRDTFFELNGGISVIPFLIVVGPPIFPGFSVLFGQTYNFNEQGIFEYEIGAAVPTIVTGKIGVGLQSKDGQKQYTVGVRPFPLHTYAQFTHKTKKNHAVLYSVELSPVKPFGSNWTHSFGSIALATIGWRFYR